MTGYSTHLQPVLSSCPLSYMLSVTHLVPAYYVIFTDYDYI